DQVKERISRLEEKISEVESHVKNRDKVDESDFKALIDEVENQDDQIDEIREGYVELGEMMQLVLEELKN
ncbi:hypothetical protein HRED_03764, partial [Candidatus Haloredivivus sp. G17]